MVQNVNNLIWIDLEMTGLDPVENKIIEIATIVTDSQLNVLAEGPVLAVAQPESELAKMDEWNVTTHTETGLIERVRKQGVTVEDAQRQTLAFLSQWLPQGLSPICGNTVGQDRRFLLKYMPELNAYFHYRSIDVSTIKELVKRWQPKVLDGFTKQSTHKALDDIRDSIAELAFYRDKVFKI